MFTSESSKDNTGNRLYDVIVFGASGLTGKYVIEELWLHHPSLKWATAGRNRKKVQDAIEEVRSYVHVEIVKEQIAVNALVEVPIIVSDVDDLNSLTEMCQKTKVLINCVGPFNFYGEKVVVAAINSGTHHVDVCGEPLFLDSMQLKYFNAAQENHVYVVGSCGFDSVPCDIGVQYLKSQFEGELCSVETYLKFIRVPGATANFATWESAINGFHQAFKLKSIRNKINIELFKQKLPKNEFKPNKPILFKDESIGGWCVPFVGSDKSVCNRTQLCNFNLAGELPVSVSTYLCVGSLLNAIGVLFLGLIFGIFAKFSYGQNLLKKYPEFFSYGTFSKSPPVRENKHLERSSIYMMFKGLGWSKKSKDAFDRHSEPPCKEINCVFSANDNGYPTTAVCVVSCAELIIKESDKLPKMGGVYTPGTAFKETTLMEKMKNRGLVYMLND